MRKSISLPLMAFMLLLSFGAIGQHSPFLPELNFLQKENLKGAVKSIDTKEYKIEDKTGGLYNASQVERIIISIDKRGNETEVERIFGNGSDSNKKVHHFNKQGLQEGHTFYSAGKVVEKQVRQFNNKGHQVGLQFFRGNGEMRKRWVFQLYADGSAKEIKEYDSNDTRTAKILSFYYKDDNKYSEKFYGKELLFISWSEYTFNDKGLLIQKKNYDEGGGPIGRILFTYDARGNMLERLESVRNANNTTRYVFTFDENDNVTSEKKYDKHEVLMETKTYAYLYDTKGNWIERLEYVDGVEMNLDKRTIVYY